MKKLYDENLHQTSKKYSLIKCQKKKPKTKKIRYKSHLKKKQLPNKTLLKEEIKVYIPSN